MTATTGTPPQQAAHRFGPFSTYNYRLYFGGQAISLIGTWMQQVAMAWLVLTVTGSGTTLGLVIAAQMLPLLLLGPWGGLMADRFDKRNLLVITQVAMGVLTLLTGILVSIDAITLPVIFGVAVAMGVVTCVANPTRQAFVSELVSRDDLRSAISMSSVLFNAARAIGPAIAGVLIATVGIQACFYIDAATYVVVLVALLLMRRSELSPSDAPPPGKGQIREGLRYVRNQPQLFTPLVMMVIIGTLAYEFQVVLPLVASETFAGQADTLGWLTSAQGAGAVVGGLYFAKWGHTGLCVITRKTFYFAGALALAAAAPTLPLAIAAMFLVGLMGIQFLSAANSTIQLTSDPAFRGRIMALWSVAFLGTTPIGGPIVGWISETVSPRFGLLVGAVACVAAGLIGVSRARKADESYSSSNNGNAISQRLPSGSANTPE